jgi:hypothetical protein
MKKPAEHPAKFTDEILDLIAEIVKRLMGDKHSQILDVFGGIGKIGLLKKRGVLATITSNELEGEWATQGAGFGCDVIRVGDARLLPWGWREFFDLVITSCVYGNRMSDNFKANDKSKRITYRHKLGRVLTPGNAGMMYFRAKGKKGYEYRVLHQIVCREIYRVLSRYYILNTKNFWNGGELHEVSEWHLRMAEENGFRLIEHHKVDVDGMGYGQNRDVRVDHENVYVFEKAA